MNQEEMMKIELQRYYALWKDCNAMYEEWSKTQGLSSNGILMLYSLCEEESCTQKSISQKWGIPKQTVNTILKDFQEKGYVEMVSQPEDKRNKMIQLTETGKTYAEQIIGKLHRKELHMMNKIGLEAMKDLNDRMELLAKAFREGGEN